MLHYTDILKSPFFFLNGVMGRLLHISQTYIVVIIYIRLNDFREKEVNTWLRIYCLWITLFPYVMTIEAIKALF